MSDNVIVPDFTDDVTRGQEILGSEAANKWELGEIASRYAPSVKNGGPGPASDEPTLSALAEAWDVELPRVSEWRACFVFYPPTLRLCERFRGLSWYHFNAARRKASGKPENAEELLDFAVVQHMGVTAFREHLKEKFKHVPPPADEPAVEPVDPDTPDEITQVLVIPTSDIWDDEYYDWPRNLLPDDVTVGEHWEIAARRVK